MKKETKKLLKHVWSVIKRNPFRGEGGKKHLLLLNIMQWSSTAALPLLSLMNFYRGNTFIGWLIAGCFILNIPISLHTTITKKEKPAIIIYNTFFCILFTYAVYAGPNDTAGVLWIISLPMLNMMMFGILPSIILCLWFLLLFIVLAASPALRSLLAYPYPDGQFLRYIFMYVSDLLISFFVTYESASSQQYQDDYAQRLQEALDEERDNVNEISLQTIYAINKAVEAKDKFTGEQSKRVADISCRIASRLGWSESELKRLYDIALLHDIGKIGVNYDILIKTGELTDEEFETVKQHAVIGGDILKDIDYIPGISPVIRHHHEAWNGSGYPDGLKGDEIPIEARILAVADTYDAMRHGRSFREKVPLEQIRKELTENSGILYDPEIVTVMLELCAEDLHE